jgi:hypothetical protein
MSNSPFPPFMMRKLTFFEPNLVLQSAASFLVREWRINDVYDPDPLLGGGTVAGFNELAAIYRLWRVENFRVRFEVASNEPALPLTFGIIFRDIRPSTVIAAYADAQNAMEVAPTSGPALVGQTTGNSVYRSPWYKLRPGSIVGNPISYMSDIAYQGTGGSAPVSPTQNVWLAFLLLSIGAVNPLTNGAIVHAYMEFTVRWYSGGVVQE